MIRYGDNSTMVKTKQIATEATEDEIAALKAATGFENTKTALERAMQCMIAHPGWKPNEMEDK